MEQNITNPSFFERVTKNFSLLTIFCFLLGYTYNYSYYHSFQIDILNYLSTTEVFYTLLPLATTLMGFAYSLVLLKGESTIEEKTSKKRRFQQGWRIIRLILVISVPFLNILILPNKYGEGYKTQPFFNVLGLVFAYYFFLTEVLSSIFTSLSLSLKQGAILVFFGYYIFTGYGTDKAKVIKRWGNETHYIIKTKAETIKTDNTQFIIGETQSNLFLYSKRDSSVRVIKREQIDSLVIR